MKLQKLSLVAALAAALFAVTSNLQAQENKPDRPPGGPRAGQRGGGDIKERLARIAEELQLTADQKTKVEAALKQQAETLRGLRDATPEDRREKMQAARKAFEAEMKGILTADQYAKWEKMREDRRGEGRGPRGPGGNRPEKN